MNVEIIMTVIALIIFAIKILIYKMQSCKNSNIYGNWLSENNSYYSLNDDGTYTWYKDTNNTKDNYKEGTMVVINGQKALKELEITDLQFNSLIGKYTNNKNDVYHIKLTPQKAVTCGITKNYIIGRKPHSCIYIIILPDGRGIFTNLETDEVLQFSKIED